MPDILTNRALNRATLARQCLLRREAVSPLDVVHRLVGLQAQNPHDPYLALWSRVEGFDPFALSRALVDRAVVRIVVMRGTIHLTTADDAGFLRALTQPVLDAEIRRHGEFAPLLVGVDIQPVMSFAHRLLSEEPLSGPRLRAALADAFPDLDAAALAYACRCQLPLVQVPPRGEWGKGAQVTVAPLDTWTGRQLPKKAALDDLVVRYLAAFGPASTADFANWCRLTAIAPAFERLRPKLVTFRSESGRELFDLPHAPRPDAETPVPCRFLPEYDNVLLGHADRSRFGAVPLPARRTIGPSNGTVLIEGEARAMWWFDKSRAGVTIDHLHMTKTQRRQVEAEADRAMRFLHPGTDVADPVFETHE